MRRIGQVSKIDRPELGEQIPLVVFRAFRHFSANYVEDLLGRGAAMAFQNGGRELGKELGEKLHDTDLETYLGRVVQWVKESKIGLLRPVELSDERLVVALDECITCAGMDNIGKRICHFEVGLVAGVVEAHLKKKVRAHETKCNANGEATCEVTVELA
jgi:predicted hydrocarbon binding protein